MYAVVGVLAGVFGLAAIAYVVTPAFMLEPAPPFDASLAVIALLVSARFLWWAFAPLPKRKD